MTPSIRCSAEANSTPATTDGAMTPRPPNGAPVHPDLDHADILAEDAEGEG